MKFYLSSGTSPFLMAHNPQEPPVTEALVSYGVFVFGMFLNLLLAIINLKRVR